MLKTRILKALLLAPLALLAVFLLPSWGFRLALAALLLVGTNEFRALADLGPVPGRALLILQILILLLMSLFWTSLGEHALALLWAACLAWCVMFTRLITYRDGQIADFGYRVVGFASALACVTFSWFSLSWLHQQSNGPYLIILLLLIIWAADVGAYLTGKTLGKNKLAVHISPGKTWEGLIGGLILSCILALLMVRYGGWMDGNNLILLAVFIVTIFASVGGDLFMSLHKRTVGLKDTGNLFPGHGGVFDRLDSLAAGAPFFALGVYLLRT